MRRSRRRDARTVAKLVRALAVLDPHAQAARPARRRTVKLSLGS
jgi:hypothetical protein